MKTELRELSKEDGGVNLCRCNECDRVLIDRNAQIGAKCYDTRCVDGELRFFKNTIYNKLFEIEFFWGCDRCFSDSYLIDI